jgi:hypothetical protein
MSVSRGSGGLRPAKAGGGAVGGALQLSKLALAGRAPAVEACPIEVEALPAVARFLTQPLSLVPRVPRCVHAVGGAVTTLGLAD